MTQNEYATLIYYWHGDPHPERIDEIFGALETQGWLGAPVRVMAVAGVVNGLETLYPDQKLVWIESHPALYKTINLAIYSGFGQREWADYHIAHWFITHDLQSIDKILDRVAGGGESGMYARVALATAAEKCVPFRYALMKAQKARADAMIINVTQ